MKRATALATASLAALAGCTQTPEPCVIARDTLVPLTLSDDGTELTVPATLSGHKLTLIVDTGSEYTMLSESSLAGRTDEIGQAMVDGIGGERDATAMLLTKLQLGKLQGGVTAVVLNKTFTVDGHPVDGLLGMNLLGAYDVDLDVQGGQLGLYEPHGDCSLPNVGMATPLYAVPEHADDMARLSPRITVQIAGQNLTAVLDTGSNDTTLFRTAAHRIGLTEAVLAQDSTDHATGIGRHSTLTHLHWIKQIDIGDLGLRNVQMSVVDQNMEPGTDMLLGMDFVRLAHVWISNSSHSIVIQYPPTPTPASLPAR